MGQSDEGQLYKYTNVVKGWQHRWFVLNHDSGILEYYMVNLFGRSEDMKHLRPRGYIHLSGAVVSPSEEDSNTFSVNSASGEVYRLRALDAKERQLWVNRLRSVAERHGQIFYQSSNSSIQETKPGGTQITTSLGGSDSQQNNTNAGNNSAFATTRAQQRVMCNTRTLYDAFYAAQEILVQAELNHHALAKAIEDLPTMGSDIRPTDPSLLLLKATSQATLLCLKHCLGMLQHQQQAASFQLTGVTGGATMELLDPYSYSLNWSNNPFAPEAIETSAVDIISQQDVIPPQNSEAVEVNSEDEKMDEANEQNESEISSVEEHRTLILQRLTQLKLGMDLTQVVLPTLILEPRSLLETYANFMSHPDIFMRIASGATPEARMLAVVEWYLTSFHVGRKSSSSKKPYNPILGELFLCSWRLSDSTDGDSDTKSALKLKYIAEQISHHPPVSAFYVHDSDNKIWMNASVTTKAKFMGMSVGVNLIGEAIITLPEFDESYVMTFPSIYARSILSVPWVELGGKVSISCSKSGYTSSITFNAKPFYGGKVHRVSAEVKNALGGIICKVHGEWNGSLEFHYAYGDIKVVDTTTLNVYKKFVRPLNIQSDMESRKVWQFVTSALREDNMKMATEQKRKIEECQRVKLKLWKEAGQHYIPIYFRNNGGNWEYKDCPNST